jgi:biopolymer transport protein ExbD
MSIPVTCPQCGAINKVNRSLAGRRVRCPKCDTAVHVPELEFDPGNPPPLPAEEPPVAPTPASTVGAPAPASTVGAPTPARLAEPDSPIADQPVAAAAPISNDDADLVDDDDDDDSILQRPKREEEELDMTPMVDVTFLLLIFFMVTAAFSLQKSIEMPRQQTDAPSTTVVEEEEQELDMVEVQVDEFGSFLVLAADWQEETPGKQNLITTLKRAREGGGETRLVIKVHELCKLQYLVDAMDAGTIAGYAETQVTQVEQFD